VGRLDEDTTGLLIVTNDGDLAQKLAHPRYRIYRQYKAQVAGLPTKETFEQLKEGFYFTEGKFRVYDIKAVKRQGASTWVEITMIEGQNREIRRLFARVGHKVMKLERIGFGPLNLGRLPQGQFRELTPTEMQKLQEVLDRNITGKSAADRRGKGSRTAKTSAPSKPARPSGGPPKKKAHTGKQTFMTPARKKARPKGKGDASK
jgi:23S rRNA pseudouridine2605 synthase